jgi:hypothetical protein
MSGEASGAVPLLFDLTAAGMRRSLMIRYVAPPSASREVHRPVSDSQLRERMFSASRRRQSKDFGFLTRNRFGSSRKRSHWSTPCSAMPTEDTHDEANGNRPFTNGGGDPFD